MKNKFNIIFSSYYLSTLLVGSYYNYKLLFNKKKYPNKLPILY